MDYGQPAAQFNESDVLLKAKPFVGEKITVKGVVSRVDTGSHEAAWVYLGHGIRCNFGKKTKMAESMEQGSTVYVDGFLTQCEDGDIVLEPAGGRDQKAPFSPM